MKEWTPYREHVVITKIRGETLSTMPRSYISPYLRKRRPNFKNLKTKISNLTLRNYLCGYIYMYHMCMLCAYTYTSYI